MLVKNIHINGREGLWQIAIEDGKIARILPNEECTQPLNIRN